MEANRELAEKAELTAVSVKIITLVTLFFLPGTFISVSSLGGKGMLMFLGYSC